MSGFIALSREAFDHPILRDGDRFRAWFWLVARACWKPTPFDVNGKVITLERGQLCTSRNVLAREWGWSGSAVERFLTRLETEQMIGRATGQGRSVITIQNYDKYQMVGEEAGQATGQATGQAADKQRTAKEQGNKGTSVPDGTHTLNGVRKGHRLPENWKPEPITSELGDAIARWPPGAIERELARFRDWAASANGPNAVKKDWQAAWRNWLRKAEDEGRHGRQSPRNSGQVASTASAVELARQRMGLA